MRVRRTFLVAVLTAVLVGSGVAAAGPALAAPAPVSNGPVAPAGADTDGHGWAH